jgi:hypothetical protein
LKHTVEKGDRFRLFLKGLEIKMLVPPTRLIKAMDKPGATWSDLDGEVVIATKDYSLKDDDQPFRVYFEKYPEWEGEQVTVLAAMNSMGSYLEPISKGQIHQPACVCQNVMAGCKCGAFQAEMIAKGKVYDQWTRSWTDR